MLQFNAVVCPVTAKFTSRFWGRLNATLTTSATPIPLESAKSVKTVKEKTSNIGSISSEQNKNFNEFKKKLCSSFNTESLVVPKIQNAKNIQELMEMTNTSLLSQNDVLKVKEAITAWLKQNKTQEELSGSVLSQQQTERIKANARSITIHEDISIYDDLSTSGMIKELYKLALENQRNVPILKYLFQNIIKYNKLLNSGQCSSLLLSMSKLSYPDERLLQKVCADLQAQNAISSLAITKLMSLLRSMAIIKYKNHHFLIAVCNRIEKPDILYDNKYIIQILLSMALLGYDSEHVQNIIKKYIAYITMKTVKHIEWVNFVWSLVVLNAASTTHVESVLQDTFIDRLMTIDPKQNVTLTLKLLNINGYAKSVLKNYSGPLLKDTVKPLTCKQTTQKELYIQVLEETLKNIVPSPSHFKINVNTNMGFLIDAVLYMDSNFRPVCINDVKETHLKVAIMILDYHELCVGMLEPHGLPKLQQRLLTSSNYDVLSIPYPHFGLEDKLERRVTYLKRQLWKKYNK